VRKLTLSLAVMAALLPARGYPLGLGELELNSALNQELNADIEVISASSEDASQILVKLADRDAFSRAGIDRPFLLQQLKFKIIEKNGRSFVKVYTKKPIREPFLSFLLEIDWPQGHLLREYTLLLDPPVYNTGATSAPASTGSDHPFIDPADAQAQAQSGFSGQQGGQSAQTTAAYQSAPSSQSTQTGVISSDSGRSVSYQYQAIPQGTSTPGQYRVQQHDTLWSIANRMRPDSSVSIEQMMLALARKNPEAFIQENINGVKRGYILRTPSRDEINQIDRQDAVAQAREHGALWREYSQGAYSGSPASSLEADQSYAGGTAADQPRDADGHLSIVSANEDQGSEYAGSNQDPNAELARLKQDLALAREQLESEKLEKEDLRSRLASLEERVKRVIEMDDGELAELQQELQDTQQSAAPVDEPVEVIPDETIVEDIVEEPASEESEAQQTLSEEVDVLEEGAADLVEEQPAEDAVFADETEALDQIPEETAAPATAEPVKSVEPPAFAQEKPEGLLASLMADPKLIGMLTGGLAFLFLLIALVLKKLRGNKSEEDEWNAAYDEEIGGGALNLDPNATIESGAPTDMESTAEMMAASMDTTTRVKPVEGGAADDLQSNQELQDALLNLDTGDVDSPKDDVLAEADVYIAYGIYQQAEELLKTAIEQNPDRDDYRLKLLETHYAAKNATEFEQLAQEVKPRKGSDKEFWGKVAVMGAELIPGNNLFAETDSAVTDMAESDLGDLGDLGLDDSNLEAGELDLTEPAAETDFDLGMDDTGDFNASLTLSEPVDTSDLQAAAEDSATDSLESDEENLESDLGLDLENDLAMLTSEFEAVEPEAPADAASDLEFDLGELDEGLGDVGAATEEAGVAESTAAADVLGDASELDIDDDFSLDFDASDLGFEETEDEVAGAADGESLDADLDLGVDLDDSFSADAEGDALAMDQGSDDAGLDVGEMDLDDMDLGDIDLGDSTSAEAESADIDLGDMDIDLGETDLGDTDLGDADLGGMDLSDDGDFDISELSEDVDEVSTKLDLARAYIDMGDKDGARSILDEVKAEGNNEQQQEAEALLQQAS